MSQLDVIQSDNLPKFSDKINLPTSILEELVNARGSELPHPLIFTLSGNNNNTHCLVGVREFSAGPGTVEVPWLIFEKLGCTQSVSVSLCSSVPKGTKLVLKLPEAYSEIINWKWFLEGNLKNYTTLTRGDVLYIEKPNKTYELIVAETEPDESICLIDTDLDLDIQPLNEQVAREMNRSKSELATERDAHQQLALGTPLITEPNTYHTFDISTTETAVIKLSVGDSVDPSEFDVVVSTNEYISRDSYIWSSIGTKRDETISLPLDLNSPYLSSEKMLYVLPVSWSDISLKVELGVWPKEDSYNTIDTENRCSNCGATIPANSKFLHQNFCLRNNIKCSCGKVFLRKIPELHWHCEECETYGDSLDSKQLHFKLKHARCACNECEERPEFANKVQLALHKATVCDSLLHECRFCHLVLPRGKPTPETALLGFSQHEYECGSKTTECYKCGVIVKLRDMQHHEQLHQLEKNKLPRPVVCANVNCVRMVSGQGNELGVCDVCFGPSYSTVHDPDGKKLKMRLERRYVIQMTKGCGNSWCKNPECKSSGLCHYSGVKDVLQHVQKDLLGEPRVLSFCVDQTTTKKKLVVDFVMDNPSLGYAYEWVCKGTNKIDMNDSESSIVSKLSSWLKDNSPQNT